MNTMIPFQEDKEEIAPADLLKPAGKLWTSADPATTVGALMDSEPISARIGDKIKIQNIAAQTAKIVSSETGELIDVTLTYLIAPDGTAVMTTANSVRQAIGVFAALYGPLPFNPPLVVVVGQKRTRAGRIVYTLKPAR